MSDNNNNTDIENGIAVIGMHCLLPGAKTAEEFWQRLCEDYEAVRDFSDDELLGRGVPAAMLQRPDYVKAGIELDGVQDFDYAFFGVSPRDAAVMDPQHRKFLECSWSALENAGHRPDDVDGAIGMFAGSGMLWYLIRNVLTHKKLVEEMGAFQVRHLANDKDFLATRASFALNIHGPSINVQTACSSSLVAVHLAMQSLLCDECDIAIAGGSTIDVPQSVGYVYREEEVRSSDGRCRTFDAGSSGTAFGSGCATVVLRRLEDAIEDGDTIHAVIRGSAINNDGSEKAGYMAPSVDYQANAIAEAIAIADVDAASIGYFECHGTATKIGDPIEIAALTQAFGDTGQKQHCAVGSVKSNIGHLDTAAGVASLIKAVHCVEHGKIPASLHYHDANPEIDFENSPFYVNAELRDWSNDDGARIAGVSSLGVGGTNAHVIVQEAPAVRHADEATDGKFILPLSAKSAKSLDGARQALANHLESGPDQPLADIAFTLQEGRVGFEQRSVVAGDDKSALVAALRSSTTGKAKAAVKSPKVVYMFSGQGAQYPGMASGLYEAYPVFREAVDKCLSILRNECDLDLQAILFADRNDEAAGRALEDTSRTQPALFTIEYALAQLWLSWGIKPEAMIGHSLGEYVAATIAGVFSLNDAVKLVAARGRLIAGLEIGSMIAVPAAADELSSFVSDDVALAGINAPELTVLSGSHTAIEAVSAELAAAGYSARALHTSHAFHSAMLDPVLEEFEQLVAATDMAVPALPFISNVSGTWIDEAEARSPAYWARHMRSTVQFRDGVETLAKDGSVALLEIGPGNTLTSLANMTLGGRPGASATSCVPHIKDDSDDETAVLTAAGQLWTHGVDVDWNKLRGGYSGRRVPLPTYAFEQHRCWLDPVAAAIDVDDQPERLPVDEWCNVPNWRKQFPPVIEDGAELAHVVLFVPVNNVANTIVGGLREVAGKLSVVHAGQSFETAGEAGYTIDPADESHYRQLFDAIGSAQPLTIVHAWSLGLDPSSSLDSKLELGFYSLLNLAKSLDFADAENPLRLLVASTGACRVNDEKTDAARAAVLGPVRVIPNEFPDVTARFCDFDVSDPTSTAAQLRRELLAWPADVVSAYRAGRRYVQSFDTTVLPEANDAIPALRHGGVYLITGGFGGLGRELAEYLARHFKARLVLLSRHAALRGGSDADAHSREAFVQTLEEQGAEVHRIEADIGNVAELSSAFQVMRHRFDHIDGVFHTAGHLDDALIPVKRADSAAAVLRPKIHGTLALEQALANRPPHFQVNYSSVSALAGPPGQIDYAAANAFLDAYSSGSHGNPTRQISLAWSSWEDSGMAARIFAEAQLPAGYGGKLSSINDNVFSHAGLRDDGADFFGAIRPASLWYLNEHRLRSGDALLPGTAYVELINAAFRLWRGSTPVEIQDLIFAVPLQLHDSDRKILHCEFNARAEPDHFDVTISSWSEGDVDPLEHVHAVVSALNVSDRPSKLALENVAESGGELSTIVNEIIEFGPRWTCIAGKTVGDSAATVTLRLADGMEQDLIKTPLHPALLDIATGGAPELFVTDGDDETGIVPFRYKSLRIWDALQPRMFSLISRRGSADAETLETDIRIVTETGEILVDIEGFEVRRVEMTKLTGDVKQASPSRQAVGAGASFVEGISADEGHEVIARLLGCDTTGHVIVSPQRLDSLLMAIRKRFSPDEQNSADEAEEAILLERPELGNEFVEPGTDAEKTIAQTWQNALGIAGIGINDNFFELGGHSLLLTQIVSRLRRECGWNLPLDRVFDELTIREWAAMADECKSSEATIVKIARVDRSAYRAAAGELKRLQ